jgi:hypothetical protein
MGTKKRHDDIMQSSHCNLVRFEAVQVAVVENTPAGADGIRR